MNKLLLVFHFMSLSIIGFANSMVNIDSLEMVLKQYETAKNTEQTVEVLFQIGNHYYNEQQDSLAMLYMDKALEQVMEEQKVLKGRLLYKKGMLVYFSGKDFEMAKRLFEEAKILYKNADTESQFVFLILQYI